MLQHDQLYLLEAAYVESLHAQLSRRDHILQRVIKVRDMFSCHVALAQCPLKTESIRFDGVQEMR